MRAGKQGTSVDILRKGNTRDSEFGDAPDWVPWKTVWAEVRSDKGGEQAPVDQVEDFDIRHVRFSYYDVITDGDPNESLRHDMCIVIDGQYHDIDQIHPDFSGQKKDVRVRTVRKPLRT